MKEPRSWVAKAELPEVDLNPAIDAPTATKGNKTAQLTPQKHKCYLGFLLLLLLQEHLLHDLLLLDQESSDHPGETDKMGENQTTRSE